MVFLHDGHYPGSSHVRVAAFCGNSSFSDKGYVEPITASAPGHGPAAGPPFQRTFAQNVLLIPVYAAFSVAAEETALLLPVKLCTFS